MKPNRSFFTYLTTLLVWLCSFMASADVRLPALISNGMVLQQNLPLNIWGWAQPAERVTVKFNSRTYHAITGGNGEWIIKIKPLKAGGPFTMDIFGDNHISVKDILVGDVWFCSGQSNMVLPMERVKEKYPDEVANARYPQIRNFFVATVADVSNEHSDLPPGQWKAVDPQSVLEFGAASYFFAKQLYQKYHVPVGIINSSVGGTPIQAWISRDGIKEVPKYAVRVHKFRDTAYLNRLMQPALLPGSQNSDARLKDNDLTAAKAWYDTTYRPKDWHKFWLPGFWADQGVRGLNGVVWFRKEIIVPADMSGQPAKLFLGRIVDADETYVNGQKVGNITYQYPPRRYTIPAGLLKAGVNSIVVRVTNTAGKGGFVPDKRYELTNGTVSIDLRGDWLYKVGEVYPPVQTAAGETRFVAQNEPTGLYNAMVAPATRYGIKGFVWYQGEANADEPHSYNQMLTALIQDWRAKWHTGSLPFIYAQLPNFMEVQYSPSESKWAELREAQLTALSISHTGMAVTIDAGEWNDIHPLNKKDVGERLALAASKVAYHDDNTVYSGPIYSGFRINGDKIIINFTNTGSGLMVKNGSKLMHFAIAGADKKFVWANAEISGNSVIVLSHDINEPKFVRYAWADNPETANLYNREGLPASPFTTEEK